MNKTPYIVALSVAISIVLSFALSAYTQIHHIFTPPPNRFAVLNLATITDYLNKEAQAFAREGLQDGQTDLSPALKQHLTLLYSNRIESLTQAIAKYSDRIILVKASVINSDQLPYVPDITNDVFAAIISDTPRPSDHPTP